MNRDTIITEIRHLAHTRQDASFWLYGSQARGEARADSDFDILVLLNKDVITAEDRYEVHRLFCPLEIETGLHISPYIQTLARWESVDNEFRNNVNRERIAL